MVVVLLLVSLQLTRLGFLIRSTIPDRPRRRMFIASVSFLFTFLGVRLIVYMVIHNHGPFEWGDGAGEAYSPPGVGHPDPVSGWLWMAAGSGPIALTDFDFSEQTDVSELRRGRGTDAGRVCALAEPGAGRVLVERRTIEHRRGDTLREPSVRWGVGCAVLPRPAAHVEQAASVSPRDFAAGFAYSARAVASSA